MSVIDCITTSVVDRFWCNECCEYRGGERHQISYADGEYGVNYCRACLHGLKRLVDEAFLNGSGGPTEVAGTEGYPIILSSITNATIEKVDYERNQQRRKWGDNQFIGMTAERSLAVLLEEAGEVATACLEHSNLEEELIHVAAVAVAWLDDLAFLARKGGIAAEQKEDVSSSA